jgi:sigma-B regulation protein RsbU (phosphoserine phosphatase)
MLAIDPQITASRVLHVFHRDEANLFLGAAFATVAIMTAALCVIRKRADPLLLWLALFALLYGNRLWLQSDFLKLIVPNTALFLGLRNTVNFVVAVPAFFFFQAAGFTGRLGRSLAYAMTGVMACLLVLTLIYGPRFEFQVINSVVIVLGLLVLMGWLLKQRGRRELTVMRWGLGTFVVLALWDNIAASFGMTLRLETYGFAIFLGALGYVAVKRTIVQEQALGEIQKELDVARRIQLAILPERFPESKSFRVAARYVPMTSVAGDFYDFVAVRDSQAGLLIADVSGHGVPAAMIASMVKMAAASQRENAADPAGVLTEMNRALCGNTQSQFVTAAYVHLDAKAGELRYSAAAHPPMLLLRDGVVREIEENGLMLAAFDFATYATAAQPLMTGDRLVLYTDGIVEAEDGAQEQFGRDRLCALLKETAAMTEDDAAERIVGAVRRWAKRQEDDLTVLVCDVVGAA